MDLKTYAEEATTDSMREEYKRVQYNVYAFGAEAKRYERKAAAARQDHTRNAWQQKADEQRYSQYKNQQRLVILEAQMQEQSGDTPGIEVSTGSDQGA